MIDFKALKTIRTSRNITLTELEEKTKIQHSNISQIENGKREGVTLRTVERILEPMGYRLLIAPSPNHHYCPCHFPTQGTTITTKEETL